MAGFRFVLLLVLLASAACFVVFAVTGKASYKRYGLRFLIGAIVTAAVFFAILIADNLLEGSVS